MVVSHALSRAYINNQSSEVDEAELIDCVQFMFDNIPINEARLAQLHQETTADSLTLYSNN